MNLFNNLAQPLANTFKPLQGLFVCFDYYIVTLTSNLKQSGVPVALVVSDVIPAATHEVPIEYEKKMGIERKMVESQWCTQVKKGIKKNTNNTKVF